MNRFFLMCLYTLVGLILGGCSVVEAPEASVGGVVVHSQSDAGARVVVNVLVKNPNNVSLPLKRTWFELEIVGVGIYTAEDFANRTLPAKGVQLLLLPTAFPTAVAPDNQAYIVKGEIEYVPPGELRQLATDAKIPLPTTPFHGEGAVKGVE